jgi:hypothetical protein
MAVYSLIILLVVFSWDHCLDWFLRAIEWRIHTLEFIAIFAFMNLEVFRDSNA